jgi:hypothetical protein
MPYASIADVQRRIPTQTWTASLGSQPDSATVDSWLEAEAQFISSALSRRYVLPIVDSTDLALLREVNADLVASRVWGVIAGHLEEEPHQARALRAAALQILGYNSRTGRAELLLPGSPLITLSDLTFAFGVATGRRGA